MTYRILTVCLGNICRSPAAAAVIRHRAQAAGLAVDIDSAGTSSYHLGEPPHPRSVQAGAGRGYTVDGRGRRLTPEDFTEFDLIVTMDHSNLREVERMAPSASTARVVGLMSFAGGGEVPDPWGKPDQAYEEMYDLIESAAAGLVQHLLDSDQASGRRQESAN